MAREIIRRNQGRKRRRRPVQTLDGDDDDDIVLVSSARTKAKGGDLFIGVTHVGDDAANSRTDFARRDLRFRCIFAKLRTGDEL